ncbi:MULTISPECIES: hypothetical protein [Paraburkholderia]|uniref:hypothetical protein n=1 Tax=Paraburkholderia TaxID=1822464 RepID=UPI0011E063FC|nr:MULTISPECIES: hypothetical protein [Paraburkholderia]
MMLTLGTAAHADDFASVQYDASNNSIALKRSDGASRQCVLARKLKDVDPKFNWNQQVVLLNNTDYVAVADVQQCTDGKASPSSIPPHVGFVVDVNLRKKLYLSLDVVTAGTISYAATVSKLGSNRPIGNFPGEYTRGKSMSKLQEEGFGYSESAPGRISEDGRYVSANGSMECAIYSHPGVWDLQTGKRVVRSDGCENLFSSGN